MKRRKKCRYCHQWYQPHPQTYRHQTSCSDPQCRRFRRRRAWSRWNCKNPLYAESRRVKQRRWRQTHGAAYMGQYRQTHAPYVERNRQLQRRRNAKARGLIVKPNAWNSLQRDKLMRIRRLRLIVKPNEWSMGIERQIDGLCTLLDSWSLIVKPNAIDLS